MRVLLISANTEKINMATLPLGLACVASAARKAKHDVAMVDLMDERDKASLLEEMIERFRPDAIGVSVRNIDDQNRRNPRFLLDPLKEIVTRWRTLSGARIVLGGAGYSIFPRSVLSFLGADMGIQGEGEVIFPELIDRLEKGGELSGLPGLCLPEGSPSPERRFERNLDSLPLPDAEAWPLPSQKEELWMPVQTRRGCPLNCSYCSTSTIEGPVVRKRSSDSVVDWMARWRKGGVRRFYFVDNTFNLPPSFAKEICRRLIDRHLDIRWSGILYPKNVDRQLVKMMARAGCEQVSLGFESGSERILKKMNKRFTPGEIRQVSRLLSEHGIKQMGFLLLGGPGETRNSVEESLLFADSLGLDSMKITAGIRIYPGTLLARTAVEEGVISPRDDLLLPRFYLAKGLEDWLGGILRNWGAGRPHWIMQ
jgi:radical SAM superfamily enzyme YgiQ (UPF0313 family)